MKELCMPRRLLERLFNPTPEDIIWSAVRYRAMICDDQYFSALQTRRVEDILTWLRKYKIRLKKGALESMIRALSEIPAQEKAVGKAFTKYRSRPTTCSKILHILFADSLIMWDEKICCGWKSYSHCNCKSDKHTQKCFENFQKHAKDIGRNVNKSLVSFLNRHLYGRKRKKTFLKYLDEHYWVGITNHDKSPLEFSAAKEVLKTLLKVK